MEAFRCFEAASAEDLWPHLAGWAALGERALEDNAYLSPRFLEPTLLHVQRRRPDRIVFVYRGESHLVGVASFRIEARRLLAPLPVLVTWAGPHGHCPQPLLDRECPAEALGALLDWASRPGRAWGLVRFTVLAEEAPFLPMLRRELARRGTPFHARPDFERPVLIRHPSFDDYLSSLPKDRRRRYRKGLRDLAAEGRVEVLLHRDLSAAPDLAERFMRLEAMGWKGAGGVALEARPGDAAFFRDVTRGFSQDRRLFVVELRLGGRPVAMTVGFLAGETLFCFKIAHDPAFDAVSPGALAEIETVRMLHETQGLTKADAGTEGETYLSGFWRRSVTMWAVDVPTASATARSFVRVLPWLSRTWRAVVAVRDQARRSATKRR